MSFNETEAIVEYGDGAFNVIRHGTYVICSVTKKPEGWFWIHNRWDKKFNLN